MKTEDFFYSHNNFYPKCGTQHAYPYGYNPMVVISISSLAEKEENNLGNMHNKNI